MNYYGCAIEQEHLLITASFVPRLLRNIMIQLRYSHRTTKFIE
jgi:hypothetical protein